MTSQSPTSRSQSELAATNREIAKSILTLLGTEEQFEYIAADFVIEFPYGPSLGQPARFEGKPAMVDYTRRLTQRIGRIKMRDIGILVGRGRP